MNFIRNSRVLCSLVVLLLTTGIQGGRVPEGDLREVCNYCHMDDLLACNDSAKAQIVAVTCESINETCILGVDKSKDELGNLTSDHVCLLRSDSTTDQTPSTIVNTVEMDLVSAETLEIDDSMVTLAVATAMAENASSSETYDYQADQIAESIGSFRSEVKVTGEPEVPPPPPKSLECFACKSSSDEACLRDVDKLKTIKCPAQSDCMMMFKDGNVVRNCSSALQGDDVVLCQTPDNIHCKVCNASRCNKTPWNQCYRCTSKEDPNCSQWSTPKSVPVETCSGNTDVCLVRVTKDGDTVRECSGLDFKCPEGELCSSCSGALCNAGVFPKNRTRCIQCQGCEAEQDPKSALPCARYSFEEKCFSYVTVKSKMIRGCVSNADKMHQCQTSGPKCITCDGKDGCNSMPLMKDPSLSCCKCNSKDDPGCAWAQLPNAVVKCQNKVLYYLQETCMTDFDPESKLAVRACSFDHGACTPEDQNCHTCTGNGCNYGNMKVQECIQCKSDFPGQENCSRRAEGIPSSKCPQEVQPYQSRGCFTMTKGNATTRGCAVGLSPEDLKFCKVDGQTQCDLCMADGCNNRPAPSGGEKVTALMPVLLLILAIFVAV